ncbi:MAG: hypothetical protein KA187_07640 [Arenimonas sp.]|nr:hypothetical protein [Arenimonas sp.]
MATAPTLLARDMASDGSRRAWTWLAGVVLLACALNVLLFTWAAAIPLPVSDAWYFLAAFVAPALDGTLGIEHFFVQRDGGDHAQPLQKLVLLVHLHAADLDFRVEAMVGAVAAIAVCALLAARVLRGASTVRELRTAAVGAGMVGLVGLSLNSTGIYTWPLVTMVWMLVLVALGYWILMSGPARRSAAGLGIAWLASFAVAMLLDEMAILVVIALLLARLAYAGRGAMRAADLWETGAVVLGLVMARMAIAALSPVAAAEAGLLQPALARMDSWAAVVTLVGGPLADALVHVSHRSPGAFATVVGHGLMVLGIVAHVAYWWRVLVTRAFPERATSIVSIALMLFFYATVAGILLSRVAFFGAEYVHQPRYTLFYQLGVVAWILMFMAPRATPAPEKLATGRRVEWAWMGVFACLLGLQVWLSALAWQSLPFLVAYTRDAAGMMEDLVTRPGSLPSQGCSDILTVCAEPPAARSAVLALLVDHKLNLFSARFRARHGLALLSEPVGGVPLTSDERAACTVAFRQWGPASITVGEPFNQQPDGSLAYWMELAPALPAFQLFAGPGGARLKFTREGKHITLRHGPELEAMVAAGGPVRLHLKCVGGPSSTLDIPVH